MIDVFLEAHCGKILQLKPPKNLVREEPPQFDKFYLQEPDQVFTANTRENSTRASGRQKGRGTILKCTSAFCFS